MEVTAPLCHLQQTSLRLGEDRRGGEKTGGEERPEEGREP